MAKKQTEAETVKAVEKAEEKAGFEVLGVYVRGVCVREYSVANHGDKTKRNAEEYAGKIGGKVDKVR